MKKMLEILKNSANDIEDLYMISFLSVIVDSEVSQL